MDNFNINRFILIILFKGQNHEKFKFLTIFLFFLLPGCAGVQVDTLVYHELPENLKSRTFFIHPLDSQENSLEFKFMASHVSNNLEKHGLKEVESIHDTFDYMVFVSYLMSDPITSESQMPLFGQTDGGTTTYHGTVNTSDGFGSYHGQSHQQPTFGVIGLVPITTVQYSSFVSVWIYDAHQYPPPTRVYEGEATNYSSSGQPSKIFPLMIKGLFEDFPGKSGESFSRAVTEE